jgi:thiamine-phosphate pyrophosphorylase
VDAVQLRENDLPARELFDLAAQCKAIVKAGGAQFIVNHSLDVALASEADGVHLGWRSLPVREVRRIAPARFIIGASTHSVRGAGRIAAEAVNYLFLGPIFRTPSKEGLIEPLGLEAIRAAKQALKVPIIAIGGIKPENAREVIAAGADGIAVISAIMGAENAREAAARLSEAIRGT